MQKLTRSFVLSLVVSVVLASIWSGVAAAVNAAQPAVSPPPQHATAKSDWLATVLHAAVPREYENRKQWDKTKNLVVGVRGKLLDPRLRRKELRHGTWRRSKVTLVEPEKRLELRLANVKQLSPAKQQFSLSVSARVDLYYQQQEWRRGLRIYSVSSRAVADLEMDLTCEMAIGIEPSVLLPSVTLSPQVKNADIRLKRFKLKSLSKANGPVVREIGDLLEDVVRDHLRDKEKDIVAKINRSIEKRSDRLRFSVAEFAAGQWTKHFQLPKLDDADNTAMPTGSTNR